MSLPRQIADAPVPGMACDRDIPTTPQPDSVLTARHILGSFIALGVRDVVIAPGSRSAPFVPVLAAAEQAGQLRVRVMVDERSAGFAALGMARAYLALGQWRPAAVIVTSGTAVANLHPAVAEADAAGVPLVVISADRPHELVGTGASQTTRQVGIFGEHLRCESDLPAGLSSDVGDGAGSAIAGQLRRVLWAATGELSRDPGPVQINVRFRPPLALPELMMPGAACAPIMPVGVQEIASPQVAAHKDGSADDLAARVALPSDALPQAQATRGCTWDDRPVTRVSVSDASRSSGGDRGAHRPGYGVVVAGDDPYGMGILARNLAEKLGWPLLAEPTSGARAGQMALAHYSAFLSTPEGRDLASRLEHIVVVGHPSLTRPVSALLARRDVAIDVLTPTARWTDVAGVVRTVIRVDRVALHGDVERETNRIICALQARPAQVSWMQAWRDGVENLGAAAARAGVGAREVACEAWRASQRDGRALVLGSSMGIRYLDDAAAVDGAVDGCAPRAVANRGLAGIDGTVATAIGLWHVWREPLRVVVGDLTFLHDAMSLNMGCGEEVPDLEIVVLDDAGGAIFSTLEYPAVTPAGVMERFFTAPQRADVAALAAAMGGQVSSVDLRVDADKGSAGFGRGCPGLDGVRDALGSVAEGVHVIHVRCASPRV